MQAPAEIIHILWDGPFTFDEIATFTTPTDFGIYQIYGHHPVYGSDVMLYIGLAERNRFGTRIPNHEWWLENHDDGRIRVYLGRLAGVVQPSDDEWNRHIRLAERLLIHAHYPACNTKKSLGALEPALQNVHVCNWGRVADLLPEVSGVRWGSKRPNVNIYSEASNDGPAAPTGNG